MEFFWPIDTRGRVTGLAATVSEKVRKQLENIVRTKEITPGTKGYLYVAQYKVSYHRHETMDHIALNLETN